MLIDIEDWLERLRTYSGVFLPQVLEGGFDPD
jgi:hypothetical protein